MLDLSKSKRWINRKYLNWIATLSCANCGIIDETIVPHHAVDISAIAGKASSKGIGMKSNDWLAMPLCYTCHSKLHSGDKAILSCQPLFIFDTLNRAFKEGILNYDNKRRDGSKGY
tara:strand:+ start:344 stop:691 length:348 start_codon:yes stop_codon:yes gene_type:complete